MRLIDADALISKMVERKHPGSSGEDNSKERYRYMQWLADYWAIEEAPTIDLVRCADCKYSGAWFGHTMKCKRFHQLFDESFYCAFGEWVED